MKKKFIYTTGKGLSYSLEDFVVSLRPEEPLGLNWVAGMPAEPQEWLFMQVIPGQGYLGAVAIRRQKNQFVDWSYG